MNSRNGKYESFGYFNISKNLVLSNSRLFFLKFKVKGINDFVGRLNDTTL